VELVPGPAPALAGCLHGLAESLGERAGAARDESSSLELHAVAERALALGGDLAEVFASPDPAAVRWIVREADGTLAACAAPIDPAPILAQELFTPLESAVLTSATLAAPGADAGDDPFEFARRSTGIGPAARGLMLPSPFDYSRQASIVIDLLPDPSDEDAYREALGERIPEHVRRSSGRAFVLFTSRRTMEEVAPRVRAALEDDGIELLVQGAGAPPSLLLEQFRRQQPAALFGLASFWEGVDVPGPVLSHVIVTRLPFAVPDHPRDQAKAARCRRGGGEPFRDLAVPQAVLRWKQGFGRLIRNREDRGVVTVLDRRIVTRRYGRLFLDALPPCPRFLLRDGEEVAWDPAP
jgi:ATP-dependent DNA helicase DinG